ncbi:hypothetical protein T190_23145 [Sinorhizobium meliloti CCBAU 01290]|nr:hypothetical protein T190_23145 [Sinorhizobium meliloti CCBAU 01290]
MICCAVLQERAAAGCWGDFEITKGVMPLFNLN